MGKPLVALGRATLYALFGGLCGGLSGSLTGGAVALLLGRPDETVPFGLFYGACLWAVGAVSISLLWGGEVDTNPVAEFFLSREPYARGRHAAKEGGSPQPSGPPARRNL
jgi:hypothetical protein